MTVVGPGGAPVDSLDTGLRHSCAPACSALSARIKRRLEIQRVYRSLRMSLADACLVCMAEQSQYSGVISTDSHFHIYPRHRRQLIPVLMPEEE